MQSWKTNIKWNFKEMFYLHDIEGIQPKGPFEALNDTRNITKSRAVVPAKASNKSSQFSSTLQAKAVASYQQISQRDNMIEPLVHVFQIMSSPVTTVARETTLLDAWMMLAQRNIHQLVVMNDSRKVIGVLADRTILKYINVLGDGIYTDREIFVGNIIDDEFVTTDTTSDIRKVAQAMTQFHIEAMPVLEDERLVGIVTRGDILRGFAENPKLNLWA